MSSYRHRAITSFNVNLLVFASQGTHLTEILMCNSNVIINAMASQITDISIVYSTICSGADQRKYQSSALPAFELSTAKLPAQRASRAENVSFDDVIMAILGTVSLKGSFAKRLASLSGPNTHWGRVTHICVSKLATIGLANGLSPGRRRAIIWTNAGILLIGTLGTNFGEILSERHFA